MAPARSGEGPTEFAAQPPPRRAEGKAIVLGAFLIGAAGLLAYCNSLGGPFTYDDVASIVSNKTIRQLWPLWVPLNPPRGWSITVEARPVLNLSLALNYAISGLKVWSYHATNLLIHILAGFTLFGIARRTLELLERGCVRVSATFIAFIIALLWTVHPIQTESVTYVIQRAESLMGLFYLQALYCFIRYASSSAGRTLWAVLSVSACLLGMATKEVMVSAPLVIFLYDRTFLEGSFRWAWRTRRRYYLALASSWVLLAALVASGGGDRSGSVGFGTASWSGYLTTQFPAIVLYLRLVFWPNPLVFEYGTFWVAHPAQVLPQALLVLALLAGTLWALVSTRMRAIGFLGASFFLILAPTSLVPGTSQMIVEHRMYLPLAAVLASVVSAGYAGFGSRRILFALSAIVAAAGLAAATVRRNDVYATDVALWGDTVAKRPGNAVARVDFGRALDDAGRVRDAIYQYAAALRLAPAFAIAQKNLCDSLNATGVAPEAMAQYLMVTLRLDPKLADAHNDVGDLLRRFGLTEEARAEFEEALRLRPDFPEAHNNLGNILSTFGQSQAAIAQYGEALRIRPDDPGTLCNMGTALTRLGRLPEAIALFRRALRLDPNGAVAHHNLGRALEQLGNIAEAKAQYEAALRLEPGYALARTDLLRLQVP